MVHLVDSDSVCTNEKTLIGIRKRFQYNNVLKTQKNGIFWFFEFRNARLKLFADEISFRPRN